MDRPWPRDADACNETLFSNFFLEMPAYFDSPAHADASKKKKKRLKKKNKKNKKKNKKKKKKKKKKNCQNYVGKKKKNCQNYVKNIKIVSGNSKSDKIMGKKVC